MTFSPESKYMRKITTSPHLGHIADKSKCAEWESLYRKEIKKKDFVDRTNRMIISLSGQRDVFRDYQKIIGFPCHFQQMAMALLDKNLKPHTLLVLQCPKENVYGMASSVTGDALLSFQSAIQEALEELSPSAASTVFCIEACSFCPRLNG